MNAAPPRRRSAITGTVALLLALGVALLAVAVGVAATTMLANAADTRAVERTLRTEATINRLAAWNEQIETGRRGFLINGDPAFRKVVADAEASFFREQKLLDRLLADDAGQRAKLRAIERLAEERSALIVDTLDAPTAERRLRVIENFDRDRGVAIMRTIRGLTAQMSATEAGLLRLRNARRFDSLVRLYVGAGAALILLILVLATVIVVVLRYNRALTATYADLVRLNEGLEDTVAARTAELEQANLRLEALLGEVHHRVANSLQLVSAFVGMQAGHARSDEARVALAETQHRIQAVVQIHRRLYTSERTDAIALDAYLESLVEGLRRSLAGEGAGIRLTLRADPVELKPDHAVSVGVIVTELVGNAAKYAFADGVGGTIEVALERNDRGGFCVSVCDDGRGFDPVRAPQGSGLGMRIVEAMARSLSTRLTVAPRDRGACFEVRVPG